MDGKHRTDVYISGRNNGQVFALTPSTADLRDTLLSLPAVTDSADNVPLAPAGRAPGLLQAPVALQMRHLLLPLRNQPSLGRLKQSHTTITSQGQSHPRYATYHPGAVGTYPMTSTTSKIMRVSVMAVGNAPLHARLWRVCSLFEGPHHRPRIIQCSVLSSVIISLVKFTQHGQPRRRGCPCFLRRDSEPRAPLRARCTQREAAQYGISTRAQSELRPGPHSDGDGVPAFSPDL